MDRRFLKAFARIDASGRIVPGMVILRKKKPTRGRWIELQAYLCCTTSTTTTTTTTAAPTTTTTTTTAAPTTTTTTTTVPSDARLKTNIRPTGNIIGGVKEYTWDWNSVAKGLGLDVYPTTGVLAQEALEVYPEHVSVNEDDGYYRVNISAIAATRIE